MKKTSLIILISFLSVFNLYPQNKLSLELSGGVISPFKSFSGFLGKAQVNYAYSIDNSFYAGFSNSSWAKNEVTIHDPSGKTFYDVYSEYDHSLYSIFAGNRMIFLRYKTLSLFNDLEIGYQILNYIKTFPQRILNPDGTVEYLTDYNTQKNVTENLFGLGAGIGITNKITTQAELLLSIKLNSYVGSNYTGLLGSRNTYLTFMGGCIFSL